MSWSQLVYLGFLALYGGTLIVLLLLTIRPLIKGAPYVPTQMARIRLALKMAKVRPGEKVYDLGCGDGRLLFEAEKEYGAKGVGIEYSPLVYWLACVRRWLKKSRVRLIYGSYRRHHLGQADVVFCFLLPERLAELQAKFERELKPGTRIVTYVWPVPGWQPKEVAEKEAKYNLFRIYLYQVPACYKS